MPAITVTVTAVTTDVNADGVIDPGDRVDWEVTATNTGRTAVTDLNLTDSLGNAVACNQSELVRDAKTVCALATYTIGASDAGSTVTNTLVASGVDLPGVTVTSFGTSASVVVHDEPTAGIEPGPGRHQRPAGPDHRQHAGRLRWSVRAGRASSPSPRALSRAKIALPLL